MRGTRARHFRATRPIHGENPYMGFARWGNSSAAGSKWQMEFDIRHPADGKWGPARYGGNVVPSYGEFLLDLNPGHPCIEPLYHPKLTHKQKVTRLYRKAVKELMGRVQKITTQRTATAFYARQIRAEIEKNRNVDEGTAEWLLVRANEYVEAKKSVEYVAPDYHPHKVYWQRYNFYNPDSYRIFPHGFDPDEAVKLLNPYERYGIPYDQWLHEKIPHAFMVNQNNIRAALPRNYIFAVTGTLMSVMMSVYLLAILAVPFQVPGSTTAESVKAETALDAPSPIVRQLQNPRRGGDAMAP
eukprot:TRINITY_DN47465_c0_g1_i1.p1 TRINITY_DN47465_c0_g1~~TRINITY_DN47465_c0_g1_i1.p1  ORF type:complete len:323 (+),score=83.06 TRINITY_DN47465_c0_g1_i1:75-971(+)